MSPFWALVALTGFAAFALGLGGAAWRGRDSAGRAQPSLGRWRVLAAAGLALLLLGAWLAGAEPMGLGYPRFGDEAGG